MHLNPAHQSVKSCVRYLCRASNRAGSPHFKIVRFKWWEHVTCFVEQIDIYREESYFRFFKYIRVHFSLYFKERETWKLWNNSESIFEKDQGITIK